MELKQITIKIEKMLGLYLERTSSTLTLHDFSNHFKPQLSEAKLTYYIRQYSVFAETVVFLILKIVFPIVIL